ncbi:hypothetical protein PLESTF_000256000 [Pleodorina starrii]|nr:hypothetical protein PLESTF_000256000 [Pleodorina starrii]
MKANVSSEQLLSHGLRRDQVRVKVVIQELGPKRRLFAPEDLGLSKPKLVGPLIDMVAVAAAAHDGDGNGAAAAPHPGEPAAVAGPSPTTRDRASIVYMERLQANKYLALLGYKGPEKRDKVLAGGGVEEPQPQPRQQQQQQGRRSFAAAATAPAAPAAPTHFHPATGHAADLMRRLQEQLGLPNLTGFLDEDTLEVLANKHRYNTHPEKELLYEPEIRTFANHAVYWSIEPPCYMSGTDTSTAETVMQRCCHKWQKVTNLTFKQVDDAHPEADLKVVFLPFKDYDIDHSLDILKVGPDFCVFPHYLSVVATYPAATGLLTASSSNGKTSPATGLPPATSSDGKTSPDKGLPATSSGGTPLTAPVTPPDSGPKKPLPLPGRQGAAKIMIDTTWTFWMLPLGAALGLHSSGEPGDVMCPFYSEDHKCLTENDKQRARILYPRV